MDVESCTLIDNSNGAIFHADIDEAPVRVDSSVFIGNTSSNAGGALRADYSTTGS
ncbi:hypothetical protein DB30_02259 [Enhygromyxa salina]|uniref:Uncharacterized protein n=1 Tax=Enhygromyxa salina TaxID=215803 RepID=A0A0C1ZM38_9BACT|nr:hypothetical protein [Enhygromyxa salina]KIG11958.1 hypothetical protein DB30_02259 [Enhygromyxa salina]